MLAVYGKDQYCTNRTLRDTGDMSERASMETV